MMIKESLIRRLRDHFALSYETKTNNTHIEAVSKTVALHKKPASGQPVLFFNASTRLSRLSLNAAFSRLVAWSFELQGIPVVHFVCRR